MRLLLVDDEPLLRLSIGDTLSAEGHEVMLAANGEDAVSSLQGDRFDLVICDVHLPKVSGLDVLRQCRELQPGVPVIIMTAYGLTAEAEEAVQNGAAAYLMKPFQFEELLREIARILDKPA